MEVALLSPDIVQPAALTARIAATDQRVAHNAFEHVERFLCRSRGQVVLAGFIGGKYCIDFTDSAGRVWYGEGDRMSAAWADIEAQMASGQQVAA